MPQDYIPQTNAYSIPTGFTQSTTSGGGSAYLDSSGNMYIRDAGGFKLRNDLKPAGSTTTTSQSTTTPIVTGYIPPSNIATGGSGGGSNLPTSTTPRDYSPLKSGETLQQYYERIGLTSQQTGLPTSTQSPTLYGPTSYGGVSIVDYLKSAGQPSDLTSRANLAVQLGYVGSAQEYINLANQGANADINTQMLARLRAGMPGSTSQSNSLAQPTSTSLTVSDILKGFEVPSSAFEASPKTNFDLTNLLNENKKIRDQYFNALQPSAEETSIANQLNGVRARANSIQQSFDAGIVDIEGKTIPMGFIVGQARELEKRANLQLSAVQREEANLLDKLGLAQDIRKANIEALKAGMGFIESDIELAFKVDQRARDMASEAFDRALQLNTVQRQKLADILDMLQGVNPDTLTPQDQATLAGIASSLGIPFNVLKMALDASYVESKAKALSGGSGGGSSSSGGGYINSETGEEMSAYDAARSIIEANPDATEEELYLAIRENVEGLSVTDINKLIASRPQKEASALTPDVVKQKVISTLSSIKSTYSRSEAKTLAENQLKASLGLKAGDSLPDSFSDAIEDALVEVYGATFWQNLIPFGRGTFWSDLFS